MIYVCVIFQIPVKFKSPFRNVNIIFYLIKLK